MLLSVVFAREDAAHVPAALILARLDARGAANVARAVAPAWRCSPASAASRLTRYRAHLLARPGGRDLTSTALWPLLAALTLNLTLTERHLP